MSGRRVLGWSAFSLCVAACTPQGATLGPRPITPEDGPNASVRVSYTGGLIQRELQVFYHTDKNAFVVVGHLGGDGTIRILSPSSPLERGVIAGKKVHSLNVVTQFDGAPSLFSQAVSPFRNFGALSDSYDGRGHGFVFMIASAYPFNLGSISEGDEFAVVEVEDYYDASDPRVAINLLARLLARGKPFTLKFANNFTTRPYSSYASRAWDCMTLQTLGFGYSAYWNMWGTSRLPYFGRNRDAYCDGSSRYAFNDLRRNWYFFNPVAGGPVINPPVVNNPRVPTGDKPPITRTLARPWERRKEETGRDVADAPVRDDSHSRPTRNASRNFPDRETRVRTVDASDRNDPPSRSRRAERSRPSDGDGFGASSTRTTSRPASEGARTSQPSEPRTRETPARETPARETPARSEPRSEPATRPAPRSEPAPSGGTPKRDPPQR